MDDGIKNKLREIFNKHDPIGIYEGKDINFNEYDPEISGIMIRFNRSKNLSEFKSEIDNLFEKMFSQKITLIDRSRYNKLAKEIYEFLSEKQNKK